MTFLTLKAFSENCSSKSIRLYYESLKRAYDRNFPRDQLFFDVGKLRCKESSFFGHIIVICLLGLLRKLNLTESPKTVPLLRIFQKSCQCRNFMEQKKEFVISKQADWYRIKIRNTEYLFCCKIAGLLENS